MTDRSAAEQQIASDFATIDLIEAYGTRQAKAVSRKHRKACMAQIKAWNEEDGMADMSAEELMRELTS